MKMMKDEARTGLVLAVCEDGDRMTDLCWEGEKGGNVQFIKDQWKLSQKDHIAQCRSLGNGERTCKHLSSLTVL